MAKIAYTDKSKTGTGAVKQWRDVDANEVKASVNALYDVVPLDLMGVFAYLLEPEVTNIINAGTYQYINGVFVNPVSESFTAVADPEPLIRYDGEDTYYFEINWHATVIANINSTTVSVAISQAGPVVAGSVMSAFCKTANEAYTISGTCVVSLDELDTIQLVVTSDGTGDQITFSNFTTTIRRFFI